jgi:hypothetical protein
MLKSTINNLTKENRQLIESNKQLKLGYSKLRDYITNIVANELESQIKLISGWSEFLLEYYKSPQEFSQTFPQFPSPGREDIIRMTMLSRNAALKLHYQVENMKLDVSRGAYRRV